MYDKEIFFISQLDHIALTYKQSALLAINIFISYLFYNKFATNIFSIVIVFMIIFTIIFLIRLKPKKITIETFPEFIESKKWELSSDAFNKFISKNIAEVQCRITIRQEKGLPEYDYLNQILKLLSNVEISK